MTDFSISIQIFKMTTVLIATIANKKETLCYVLADTTITNKILVDLRRPSKKRK